MTPSPKEALELLPCPFCGGDAESDSQRGYRNISTGNPEKSAAIYCTKCNADMTWCYRDTPEIEREQVMSLLIEQWNTRAALSRQPSGERREAVARDTWASIEQYLRDECGLDCYGFSEGDRANCINVIVNADFLASGLVQDEAVWRDISTAPKDGTRILWSCGDDKMSVIHWPEYELCFEGGYWMQLPALPIRSDRNRCDKND